MNYAVEMGSSAMMCIPSFIKIGSAIQMLMWGDAQTHSHTNTQRARRSRKITSIFSK
jgi:hypothetical protein